MEVLYVNGWEQGPTWECLSVYKKLGLFLSVHVGDVKIVGKNQNMHGLHVVNSADRNRP